METNFKSLIQLFDYFKDEETCKEFLTNQRWNGSPSCPHCGSAKVPYTTNRGYKCSDKDCYKKFTVITGTIYENTKIGLRLWFAALYLITAHKKGISSLQLSRDLNITQKTSWFMLHRIREMLKNKSIEKLNGIVEADETYIGGKTSNKHKAERERRNSAGTGAYHQKPVLALLERNGQVRTQVIDKSIGAIIKPIITSQVSESAQLITDGHGAYSGLTRQIVNHEKGEFGRGIFHTNTVEGFFSQLKRGITGIYHQVSVKHLQRYCNEFAYRYNTRHIKDSERFYICMDGMNTRLKYSDLIK